MANVLYGMKNTHHITLKNIAEHALSVKKELKTLFLLLTCLRVLMKISKLQKNAKFLMKFSNCDAVKIESNKNNFNIIKELVKSKIPVMGHIGYTPQFKKKFKIEGKTLKKAKFLLEEALKIQEAGAFSIVLECITSNTSKIITQNLKIPTIGIGSSVHCDGQILVTDDMLGLSGFYPKFVKKYANINSVIEKSVKKYSKEVKLKKFPLKKNYF